MTDENKKESSLALHYLAVLKALSSGQLPVPEALIYQCLFDADRDIGMADLIVRSLLKSGHVRRQCTLLSITDSGKQMLSSFESMGKEQKSISLKLVKS